MCYDQAPDGRPMTGGVGISRRQFMEGTAGLATAVALLRQVPRLPLGSPAREVTAVGQSAYSMAMHIHSSFSEQDGSAC